MHLARPALTSCLAALAVLGAAGCSTTHVTFPSAPRGDSKRGTIGPRVAHVSRTPGCHGASEGRSVYVGPLHVSMTTAGGFGRVGFYADYCVEQGRITWLAGEAVDNVGPLTLRPRGMWRAGGFGAPNGRLHVLEVRRTWRITGGAACGPPPCAIDYTVVVTPRGATGHYVVRRSGSTT